MAFSILRKATVRETATEKPATYDAYISAVGNAHQCGGKFFANVKLNVLGIDESYQRTGSYNKDKVKELVMHFDPLKMDALRVSKHEEEGKLYIIDGMHRYLAAKEKGIEMLPCEILDLGNDPEKRKKKEAELFISQQEQVDRMTPLDQHKGKVLLGIKEYVDLNEIVENTEGIQFKENRNRGRQPKGSITGYEHAVKICRNNGKEFTQAVFNILIAAKWNEATRGLSNNALDMIASILQYHKGKEVESEVAKVLRKFEPKLFMAKAQGKYETRSQKNACVLLLEDYICTNLNIPRLIDPDMKERFTPEVA